VRTFIEGELFHDIGMNLKVYDRFPLIVLAMSYDGIY
jgi:hypothetical protein